MVKLGHVSIDGSKLKADASQYRNATKETLEANIPKRKEEVQRLLQQAEETDKAEDQEHGDKEGAPCLRHSKKARID